MLDWVKICLSNNFRLSSLAVFLQIIFTLPNGNDNVHPYSYATERSSKVKEYIQPYSYIKQPYLDISDISVVSVRQHIGKVENSFYF